MICQCAAYRAPLPTLRIRCADVNVVALEADLIRAQVLCRGTRQALSRRDVELRGMERAFDGAVLHETLRQDGIFVRAHVVDGVDFAVDAVERDRSSSEVDGKGFAVTQIG